MLKNWCLGTSFANQRVKKSKTLLNFAQQHFYANLPLISKILTCVWCLLVGSRILGPLFNRLTDDHMFSSHNWQKLQQQVQMELSSKPSTFSSKFIAFLKSTSNFEYFEIRIAFIASICSKLLLQKNVVTWMPSKSWFRTPFANQGVKGSKHCWSLHGSIFMLMVY